MSDASKHAGAKPRLSLFSTKQAIIRLKSDDQLDQQKSDAPETPLDPEAQHDRIPESTHQAEAGLNQTDQADKETRLNGNTQNDLNKMNISKEDLIRLLSMLKSELHSKEIALAAIKCEQLKRLINPIEISRSSLANTYMKLQDRFKQKDQNNNTKEKLLTQNSNSSTERKHSVDGDQDVIHSGNNVDEENLNILIALLELLDQHPLLALPRDSIYCLDYNCNELSTKNYLNLKIQHLDNLIDQHRRFRYYMTNRLQRSEQRLSEVTSQLEFERSYKLENGKTIYGATGQTVLLKRIEEVRESLDKEKRDKQVIVMTLLNELLDEKERANSLAEKLARNESIQSDEKSGEKKKLLMLQTEVDSLNLQLKKQASVFAGEREEMLSKLTALKNENEGLRCKLDQLEKRSVPSPKTSQHEIKESNRVVSPSSPGTATGSKSINGSKKQQAIVNSPTATMRLPKPPPPSRLSNSPNSTQAATATQNSPNPSYRQASQSSSNSRSSVLNKSPGSVSSAGEQSTMKTQHLFKSASVISTHQQSRGQRPLSNSNQLARSTSTQAAPIKPQVPAKPAQLLDQQRGPH